MARLGVRFVAFHRGLYAARGHEGLIRAARAGLRRMGFVQVARGGAIELWRLAGAPRAVPGSPSAACLRWQRKAF